MASTHRYDPLRSTSPEDQLTFIRSYQHPSDRYIQNSVAGQHSVDFDEADRPSSPHSDISSYPALSETEWDSDTASIHQEENHEENPLLRNREPPPPYDRIDPAFAGSAIVTGDQINNDPSTLIAEHRVFVPPNPASQRLIDFDIEPQNWSLPYEIRSKWAQRKERRHRKWRNCCIRLHRLIKVIFILGLCGVAVYIFRGKEIFSSNPACLLKNFASRDYQIQTLDHFDFSDIDLQNSGLPSTFSGVMHVRSGPFGQTVDLNVSIRSIVSDLQGEGTVDWRPLSLDSCAEVTLFFRPSLEISTLRIVSDKLKLILSSDVIVTESTTISLKNGNLMSENFASSREIYINSEKSIIKGTFGLHDTLSIKKGTGHMSIDIKPEAAFRDQPKPAILEIETSSGTVDIQYPANNADIPNRDYHSSITSYAGTVKGKILHGKETTLETKSGNLDIQLLPYGFDQELSSLITKMQSGVSKIEVLRPYSQHGNPLTKMTSSHYSMSGNLELKYPNEWEGSIDGLAKSGILTLKGSDVKITDEGSTDGSYVHARKGNGESKLKFDIDSGTVDTTIGY